MSGLDDIQGEVRSQLEAARDARKAVAVKKLEKLETEKPAEPEKTVPAKQYDEAIEKVGKLEEEVTQARRQIAALQNDHNAMVIALRVQAKVLAP